MAIGTPTLLGTPVDALTSGGGEDVTFTVPGGGVAQGTLLILAVNWSISGTIDSVIDSRGNTYDVACERSHSTANCGGGIAYGVVTTALQAADTITISSSVFNALHVRVYTVTGAETTTATVIDKTADAQMDFTTSYSSGNTATTTQDAELLFGLNVTADEAATYTATGSFTEIDDVATTNSSNRIQTQYRIVAATGAYASTATLSGAGDDGAALIATFKEAGSSVQMLAPSADSVDGNWHDNTGGGSLAAAIDETSFSDSDYIMSELGPSNSSTRVKVTGGTDPQSSTGHVIHWRAGKDATGGATIGMTVKMYQGGGNSLGAGTLIATFTRSNVDAFTTYDETLSAGEANSITDYTDLYLEFSANQT